MQTVKSWFHLLLSLSPLLSDTSVDGSDDWSSSPASVEAFGSGCVWFGPVQVGSIILLTPLTQLSLKHQKKCKLLLWIVIFDFCFVAGLEKLNSMLDSVKELIVNVSVCVCLYLGQSVLLLGRSLRCWARLVYRKCSKKTVERVVGPLVSLLFSNRVRPILRVVTMTVFVNEMLLMIAGDVERNPGPGKEW